MLSNSYAILPDQGSKKPISKRSFKVNKSSSHTNLYRTRSLQRLSEENKAKKVRFYRNGDKFHQGLVYAVSKVRFRSFEVLLADLTIRLADKVNLPQGVRVVFTIDGKKKINSIEELEAGESYVCASNDGFKSIDYSQNINPNWCANVRTNSSSSIRVKRKGRGDSWILEDVKNFSSQEILNKTNQKENRDFIRPKLITIIRNGVKPRKAVRMLLNKKTAHSIEQVFNDVTKVIKLDTGAVRKVFTLKSKQIVSLQDFFDDDNIFIAYGHEKPSPTDFFLDVDEAKFIQTSSVRHHSTRANMPTKENVKLNFSLDPDYEFSRALSRRRACSIRGSVIPRKPRTSGFYSAREDKTYTDWPQQLTERYAIGFVIGRGSYAKVWECTERCSLQKFALKVIDKFKCEGTNHVVANEVSILRRVKHPNVIRLIQEFDTTKKIYLVMELANGGDLFDAVSSASRYTEHDASGMLHNLASALAYLHKLHIVHRDVKPENLLVYYFEDGNKVLKLCDFGLATVVTNPLFTVCGTPTYVAPEIILQTGYGIEVDIWAAGVITYILLCGFPPFPTNLSQEALFDIILKGDFSFSSPEWDHISGLAKNLISATLCIDPKLRLTANDILNHEWLSDEVFHDRDMKTSASTKIFNLRPTDKHHGAKMTGRRRRVSSAARVLALTELDPADRQLLKLNVSFSTDDSLNEITEYDPCSRETSCEDAFCCF